MPAKRLQEFMDKEHVNYALINHERSFTTQEAAASTHIPGKEMAKTVMIKLDGHMAMAVLPADHWLDLGLLQRETGVRTIELAREEEFEEMFPECETGAMPPFGNLYGMDVLVEETLARNEMMAFNAGTHTEVMRMGFEDFEGLVHPRLFRSLSL